jgi:integrase
MPQKAKELRAVQVKALRHPGGTDQPVAYNVGGEPGLLLQITPSGSKSWLLRASVGGKVRHMGLGSYSHRNDLANARQKAHEARDLIRAGRDPIEERKARKQALAAESGQRVTFRQATERYHKDVKVGELRNERSRTNWLRAMELHAFPVMGHLLVGEVELQHVLSALEPTWPRPSTVSLRAQIEAVLEWSKVRGHRDGDNPAAWRTLKHVLSAPGKAHKVRHRAALPFSEAAAFVADLRTIEATAAQALEFLILTAARSGEVRNATWDEIDLQKKLWTIPGERMKAGKAHRVPLSGRAVYLLESLPHREGLLFTKESQGRTRALSDTDLSALKLGRRLTVHGFRSSFKDWARSCTTFADEISELALAHVSTDATRAAYARDELLPKREKLMEQWAKYLEEGPSEGATVTNIRGRH